MPLEQFRKARQAYWRWLPEGRILGLVATAGRASDALVTVLLRGELSLQAMSLVYTTLLSLVPFLALGFSLLKALGVHNSLEPVLLESLKGLGPVQAAEVAHNLIGFVENIKVGVLGSVGVALLLYSALSLIQKVETAFNMIWRVARPRGLSQRIGEYLAVLTVGPMVVFSALGATASVLNNGVVSWLAKVPVMGFVLQTASAALPYVLIVSMFTFLYMFVPNTPVKLRAAFIGGAVAGTFWQTASFVFAAFVAAATNYNAIYSGFAIVIFVLIWLQLGWLILLCGCQLAYYAQYPWRMNPYANHLQPAGRAREQLGLALARAVAQAFVKGGAVPTRTQLAQSLGVTETVAVELAAPLVDGGVLAFSGDRWLPARDPSSITVAQLWSALRGAAAEGGSENVIASNQWLINIEMAAEKAGCVTLRDWAIAPDKASLAPPL